MNYALGQGAFIYFLHRTRGVKLMRAAAAVLLIMGINLLLLLMLTSLGLLLGAGALPQLRTIVLVGYAGLAVYVVALVVRPAWLTSRPILDVLLNAGLVGHLKCMAVRLPHIITLLVLNHVALLAFGVRVPLLQSVLCIPGRAAGGGAAHLGAGAGAHAGGHAGVLHPFRPRRTAAEREATILAASLSVQAIASVVQIIIGALCIRSQVGRRLKDVSREVPGMVRCRLKKTARNPDLDHVPLPADSPQEEARIQEAAAPQRRVGRHGAAVRGVRLLHGGDLAAAGPARRA